MTDPASPVPAISRPAMAVGLSALVAALLILAVSWPTLGQAWYQRVLPFYDSLSYQQQQLAITEQAATEGTWATLASTWKKNGNTALNRLAAAVVGRAWSNPKAGLYAYLFSIHFAAIVALLAVAWRATRNLAWVILVLAAWLSALPFAETINGILDQRMDLASGAFCLMVSALCLGWSRRPSIGGGLLAGLAAALAILHRPVMAVTVAGILAIFSGRALLRERHGPQYWLAQLGALAAPVLLLALPWLAAHAQGLRFYYLVWNVAVGNASSLSEAAQYNFTWFAHAVGSRYALIVAGALGWILWRKTVDWLDLAAVALSLVLPLALLIGSRSVGSFLSCQVPLGLPALALACLRPAPPGPPSRQLAGACLASALLLGVIFSSLQSIRAQIAGVPIKPRLEVQRVITEIDTGVKMPVRVFTGFQTVPVDPNGLVALAREQGVDLRLGRLYFHPVDFGFSNAEAPTLSDADLLLRFAAVLRDIKASHTLLMLPTVASEPLLPPDPFSHVHMKVIRQAVEADPGLVRRMTTSPVNGIALDIFAITPPPP